MARDEVVSDPSLGAKRNSLVKEAAKQLMKARMINYDEITGAFTITDLGRIAAKYYIRHASIEIFNEKFRPKMSEADVLGMLSMSTEVSVHMHPSERFVCLILPFSLIRSRLGTRS